MAQAPPCSADFRDLRVSSRLYDGLAGLRHELGPGSVAVIRRRLIVHGHVQGVFFRDTTCRRAAARGIAGWVRNRPEGTVEAVFEGDPEAVEAMVAFCHEGPRGAQVERVELHAEQPAGLSSFEVR